MEDSGDVKAATLGESEELAEEQEQGEDAEDDGQDHGGLDRLQPLCGERHLVREVPPQSEGLGPKACGGLVDGDPCNLLLYPHTSLLI